VKVTATGGSLIEPLAWDSEHFGRRIARLRAERLTEEGASSAVAQAAEGGVECLYLLAVADDPATVRLAEAHGFHLVDVRATLEADAGADAASGAVAPSPGVPLRDAEAADLPALRALAGASHHTSRFYADPGFPDALCDRLYERWIENSVGGWAERVTVAGEPGRPIGYVTCHLDGDEGGRIGLVAVAPEAAGRGVGRALVASALAWFADHGAARARVVTQGRNLPAQRLYLRAGFLPVETRLWYHRWS
jgi:dTDP-4-amino-4,6-dideoxy-D-galactose acyltransferase